MSKLLGEEPRALLPQVQVVVKVFGMVYVEVGGVVVEKRQMLLFGNGTEDIVIVRADVVIAGRDGEHKLYVMLATEIDKTAESGYFLLIAWPGLLQSAVIIRVRGGWSMGV